jgi:hypothetical protein
MIPGGCGGSCRALIRGGGPLKTSLAVLLSTILGEIENKYKKRPSNYT